MRMETWRPACLQNYRGQGYILENAPTPPPPFARQGKKLSADVNWRKNVKRRKKDKKKLKM
jgi:hypothetical protein